MSGSIPLPAIVAREPRYQQEAATVLGGLAYRLAPLWHLDGIPWYDTPPPRRLGHRHVAQTVAVLGPVEEVWRCSCSAILMLGWERHPAWMDLERRYAVPWWARLLRRR